jgi:hypothetical protein
MALNPKKTVIHHPLPWWEGEWMLHVAENPGNIFTLTLALPRQGGGNLRIS